MRNYRLLLPAFFLISQLVSAADPDDSYSALLHNFVHEGKVNYAQLCKDSRLNRYIEHLQSSDPDRLSVSNDRLAFWINAYNAYTLKVICDHYPVKSINDLSTGGLVVGTVFHTTIWDKDFVIINGKKMTLNQIEHKIIRPVFKDPRAHFALVCASKSCPQLRPEALKGSSLDQQLADQGQKFLSGPFRNRFDLQARKAYLSKIFDWYGKDFGKNDQEKLLFLTKFLPADLAEDIRSNAEKWRIEYLQYDWSLNE
jgi:uncharacterized protein DUF547